MTWPTSLLALAMALLGATPAAALHKCIAADGHVSYQQQPCRAARGVELEAGDGFGVRQRTAPRLPYGLTPEQIRGLAADDDSKEARSDPVTGHTATGKPIYQGPQGGRYTLTASGRKSYLPKLPGGASPDKPAPAKATATPEIHKGPKGGCYTLSRSGRRNYLPREDCPDG